MKLTHIVIASTAALSFGAYAEGNKSYDQQSQTGASASMQQRSHASGSVNSSVIRQAQEKLGAAGHDAGTADGVMGPKTAQAIKDFQNAKGIDASGRLDQRTLSELGVSSSSVGASSSAGAQGRVGAAGAKAGVSGSLQGSGSVDTPSRSNESNPAGDRK